MRISTQHAWPRIALLLVASLGLALTMGSATAASERFTDANDRRGFDIRAVRVSYGERLTIRMVHNGKVANGQRYKYWIDTDAENGGPEYFFVFTPNSDFSRFRKVNTFTDSGSAVRDCDRMWGGAADIYQPRADVLAVVGARCLGGSSRVRVSLQMAVEGPDDWAPARHEFYDWVSRH